MTYIDYMNFSDMPNEQSKFTCLSWRRKVRIANQFWRLADYESFAVNEVALYAFLVKDATSFIGKCSFLALPFMFVTNFGVEQTAL